MDDEQVGDCWNANADAWTRLVSAGCDAGFTIERLAEPAPSDEAVRAQPRLRDAQVVAYFLHVGARFGG
jgi:hypothetical protein